MPVVSTLMFVTPSVPDTSAATRTIAEAAKEIQAIQVWAEKAEKISDVPATGDLSTSVQYGIVRGYINGTTDTTFQPDTAVTRSQFIAFLYRLAESPATSAASWFTDTVNGLGESTPRGQAVRFIYRALNR